MGNLTKPKNGTILIRIAKMSTIIHCPHCREQHYTSRVVCLGIEESIEGWDVLEYVCPEDGVIAKAVVRDNGRGNATDEEYEEVYGRG